MKPPKADRPHPLADWIGGLFAPVFAWWRFVGTVPLLIYLMVGMTAVGLLIRIACLFLGK